MLEGLRVVEFSQLIAGPLCGLTLGDWGAEVIKAEPPEGDYTRTLPPELPSGESAYFQMLNRGKRGIVVDLSDERSRALTRALIGAADVVVEGLGTASSALGIGYEEARAVNPKLIWCSITGYGHANGGRAVDPSLQASMGMMALTGEPDGPPMRLPVPLIDFMTAMYATQSVLAALLRVERGGEGVFLDCAMIDAAATLASSAGVYALNGSEPLRRMGSQNPWYVPAANFKAADGEYVQLIAINDQHWQGLARALGHPEWSEDPRFAGNSSRLEHRELLHGLIAAAIEGASAEHWEREIARAGAFCRRIREIEEAWSDPLLETRGLVAPFAPDGGEAVPIPVASLARPAAATQAPAPRLGEHTSQVAASLELGTT